MQYEKFIDLEFDKEFSERPGLYIVSAPGVEHLVRARNIPLGVNHSSGLRSGKRLLKFGMAPRSLSTRISDYGTILPNGFLIHAILITRVGADMNTGSKVSYRPDKHGVLTKSTQSTGASHTSKAETALKRALEDEGAIYFRSGRRNPPTEWVGLRLHRLKKIMFDLHKSSRDKQGHVWFFDSNDATLQNNNSGEKLTTMIATKGFTPKPARPTGNRGGLRSGSHRLRGTVP